MEISNVFHGFWYIRTNDTFVKSKQLCNELNEFLSSNIYTANLQLDKIILSFQNPQAIKSRIRPYYMAVRDMNEDPYLPPSLRALVYEIPILESEFIQVPEEDLPTYIGKALLQVLESQNVPIKIRKQFDRDRFVADVRNFFIKNKCCEF